MRIVPSLLCAAALALAVSHPASGQQETAPPAVPGLARPVPVLREVVRGMPTGAEQEVRVLTAVFQPGDRTVFHTHRAPVSVYVLEGEFTLEMEGHPTAVVRAGSAFVEPPHVRMTGYNRSATSQTRVVIFYVSVPGEPFLDPISR